MEVLPFTYMTWAKTHYSGTELSLIPSGMPPPPASMLRLPADLDPLAEVATEGPETLQEVVARAYGTELERTLVCAGSTQADLLAFNTFVEPGAGVLIEEPAYGLFASLASTRAAKLRRFARRPENDFDLDPDELERELRPDTRLVVFTTVHNPTGRLASVETLHAIGRLLERQGALGLAAEVYLDFVPEHGRLFAHQIHESLLSANSLTKVYGLGSARIGWLCGREDLIARCAAMRDILAPVLPAVPVGVAIEALGNRGKILARARSIATEGRAMLLAELGGGFEVVPPQAGIMAIARVDGVEDCHAFSDYLRREHELGVVPGEFFGLPGCLRLGYGSPREKLGPAIARLREGHRAWLAAR